MAQQRPPRQSEKDKYLESQGLLNYQTKGMSAQEIAQRYAQAGVRTQGNWFKQNYGQDMPDPLAQPQVQMNLPQSQQGTGGNMIQGQSQRVPLPPDERTKTFGLSPDERKSTINYVPAPNGLVVKEKYSTVWLNGDPNAQPATPTADPAGQGEYIQPQLNPYAGDFDWARLTVEQKKAITTSPDFHVSKVVAPGQQGFILSDKNFGLFQKNQTKDAQYQYQNLSLLELLKLTPEQSTQRLHYQLYGGPREPTTYGSQELQWWQPLAFSLLSDPKSTPLVQGAAMTAMTGGKGAVIAVPMTALAYGAQLKGNESPALNAVGSFSEFLLKPFMAGAQAVEQVQGVVDYLSAGKASEIRQPKGWEILEGPLVGTASHLYQNTKAILETGRLQEFISDPKLRDAVWQAGKVYYETLGAQQQPFTKTIQALISYMPEQEQKDTIKAINAVLPLVKEENQVWVLGEAEPVAVQPGYTLDDAVKRVLNGESADAVLGDYQRAYGISGVASDFMLSSVYDPLNALPTVVGRTNAKISEFKAGTAETKVAGLMNLGVLSEAQTASVEKLNARITIEKMKADIYRAAPGMTGMAVPWNEASRKFRALIADVPEVAQHLTAWERMIAGITPDGRVKELMPNATVEKTIPKIWQYISTLQPEAKANLFRDKLVENMNVLFDWSIASGKTDPKAMIDVIEAASKMDMVTLRDAGAEFMGSPEAYTTIGAARDVLPKLRADQLAYETLTPNRDQFYKVSEMIGDDPKVVLKGFLKDDPRPMFERLKEKLKVTDTPEAKALLKAIEEGKLTADILKQTFKPLESAPLSDIEFMAHINERMYDHLKDWGKEYFGVKDHNKWDESLRLLKGAQSLLLLDINPQSILNDFVNERVMLIAHGTLGLTDGAVIGKFKQDFGVWPEKAGGSGILGDIATEKTKLSAEMKENKSLIGVAADKLNTFRSKLPRSAASSRFNVAHHDQMIYSGIKEYWGRNWIEGKGFDRMPASLEARLREYNVDPQLVYRNARSVLRPEQLELLKTRVTSHDLGNYIADAAEKVGKTPGELTALMGQIGVLDQLRAGLEKADTPLKREQVFEGIEQKVQEYIDQRITQEIPGKIQDYIDKIKTEAHGGAMQIMGEVAMQTLDTRLEVDKIWDDAYAKVAELEEFGLRSAGYNILEEAARRADTTWRRNQTREAIYYTAAAEVLGFKNQFKVDYLKSLGDQHTLRREFFTERSRAVRQWRDTIYPNKAARSAAWYSLEAELNTKFKEMQDKTLKIQQHMNDLYVDEIRAKYGDQAAVMANAWVTKTLEASQGIHEMIVGFRDSIKGMDPDGRAEAWKQFKPEFQASYRERTKVDMEGAAHLWKGDETPLSPSTETSPQIQRTDASQGGETPTTKIDDVGALAEARTQRMGEDARLAEERLISAWDVAEKYSLTDNPFNREVDSPSLLSTLRREEYGGIRDLELNDPRLKPELVQRVMETRRAAKALSDSVGSWYEKMTGESVDAFYSRHELMPSQETLTVDTQSALRAFEAGDFRTLIYENGLVFRRMLADMVKMTDDPYLKADLSTIEEWAGVKDGNWERAHDDKFARGFERYMSEGKAPTPALVRAFEGFKNWMLEIYKTITGSAIDVNLSDDMRRVFDRMLGAENLKIDLNNQLIQMNYDPKFYYVDPMGYIVRRPEFHINIDMEQVSRDVGALDVEGIRERAQALRARITEGSVSPNPPGAEGWKSWASMEEPPIPHEKVMSLSQWTESLRQRSLPELEVKLRELEGQYSSVVKAGGNKAHLDQYITQLDQIKNELSALERSAPDTARVLLAQLMKAQELVNKRLAVAENYLSSQETIGFQHALDTDPQSPLFRETGEPSDPRQLFKDGGDMPLLAPGGYDQLASRMDATKLFEDGWSDQIRPVLEAMKESANSPERRFSFEGMDSQTQKELNQYLTTLNGKMATTKHAASKWGETNAEYGLLNYDRQYGFDKIFSAVVPYEFFGTRTGMNWLARVMDRPAYISQTARFLNLRKTYENDLPERLRGKMWIPMPFMPKWAGGGMWIDPTNQLIPFKPFLQPLTAYKRDQQNLINNTMYVLRDMEDDPSVNKQDVINAMETQSGPLWERALAQTKADQGENTSTGADYFSMLFSPALYASIPYYLATGKKLGGINSSWPSGQLPITRVGSALETAFKDTSMEWVGDIAGLMARPEKAARKALGLSEFGEWGEYYIERQLVNMAAEDGYNPKEVQKALIEKNGPLYEEATNRVRYELMLKVPGMAPLYAASHGASLDNVVGALLTSLYPGGLLPPAEMEYKGLKQEFGEAWKAKASGDDKAITKFFDEHPEYAARLALRKDPEERMQQFLQSEVWDAYEALGTTDRKMAVAELGLQEFFDAEPGAEYTTEQLVAWVRGLKGMVPQTPVTQPLMSQPAPTMNLYSPAVTGVTDQFFEGRKELFPNYYEQQQGYYALPKSERAAYLLKTPELKKYWDWKKDWYESFPQYVPIFNGQAFKTVDTSNWPPALEDFVRSYAYTGKQMPSGAYAALQQVWIMEGQPMGDFETWVDSQVVPAMLAPLP